MVAVDLSLEYDDGKRITIRKGNAKVVISASGDLSVVCMKTTEEIVGLERVEAVKMIKSECAAMQEFWNTVLSSHIDKMLDGILSVE